MFFFKTKVQNVVHTWFGCNASKLGTFSIPVFGFNTKMKNMKDKSNKYLYTSHTHIILTLREVLISTFCHILRFNPS